jgi:8-oxo-dGTP pyrophosphatase MutT (NUDIX family)
VEPLPYPNDEAAHYHLSVGACVLNHAGEVLLLHRPSDVYILPTGTLEEGETLQQTLARELKEETGASAQLLRYIGATDMPFMWDGRAYEKTILWHELQLLDADESKRAQDDNESAAAVVWFTLDKAKHIFIEQGRKLNDWDFSPVIARLH